MPIETSTHFQEKELLRVGKGRIGVSLSQWCHSPKGTPELWGPYARRWQKRAKMPEIYPEPGRRAIGIHKSRQHQADNIWLCQLCLAR